MNLSSPSLRQARQHVLAVFGGDNEEFERQSANRCIERIITSRCNTRKKHRLWFTKKGNTKKWKKENLATEFIRRANRSGVNARRRKESLGRCSVGKKHVFSAHPNELYQIACRFCGKRARESFNDTKDSKLVRYLSSRRKQRFIHGLSCLYLPLDSSSHWTLSNLMSEFHITSNTTGGLHITLLEGAVSQNQGYKEQVAQYLLHDPFCHVMDIELLDPTLRLVTAKVDVPAWNAVKLITATQTRLPPWPHFQIALGTMATRQVVHLLKSRLGGQSFLTVPVMLAWLGPQESCRPYKSRLFNGKEEVDCQDHGDNDDDNE